MEYLLAAKKGGKRKTLKAGDKLEFDHGLEIVTLVANAVDIDGDKIEGDQLFFTGRRSDCAENDLSIGLLIKFGKFRYLIAGDLTGDPDQKIADVEELIKDDAKDADVYHVNHHGSKTSSSKDIMQAIKPTVAIVSNGGSFCHPTKEVIKNRILKLDPNPAIYLTNKPSSCAWKPPKESIADHDRNKFDGIIEIAVWKKSYRVIRWENGKRQEKGDKFFIKNR